MTALLGHQAAAVFDDALGLSRREPECENQLMAALPPDYDADPDRWQSWEAPQDVHHMVAPEMRGPVLDVGCGEGGLA
jgi:hypothetical protein